MPDVLLVYMAGKSLLRIWKVSKCFGVIGVLHCQGVGNWPMKEQRALILNAMPIPCSVSPSSIECIEEIAGKDWSGDCAVPAFDSGTLSKLQKRAAADVLLRILQFEIYIVSPINDYDEKVRFAPLGLIVMDNSGGDIVDLRSIISLSGCAIKIQARSPGRFRAYSSTWPVCCSVDNSEVELNYDPNNGLLSFHLSDAHYKNSFSYVRIKYLKFRRPSSNLS
ncbi:unnamed protein product [Musa acuminata var. zebrina]